MTAPESQNSHSSHSSASSDSSRSSASSDPGAEDRSARTAVTVFPVLILAAFAVALLVPTQLSPLSAGTNYALGIIMFGMGLTLTPPDFALVVKRPLPVLVGVVAQFVIMPTLAWVLAKAFQLDPMLAAGVILVGCAPGGTSSNVISYLARGDVALSVTMTSISTLLAPLMTPLLTQWLAGQYMPVDAGSMAMSIVRMVLVPVVGGLIVRVLFSGFVERILPAMPWVSVLGICYVVLAVVSKSATTILSAGLLVLLVPATTCWAICSATAPDGSWDATPACAGPSPSRSACRTRGWPPPWRGRTSRPRRPCPVPSSPHGTICPAPCSPRSTAVVMLLLPRRPIRHRPWTRRRAGRPPRRPRRTDPISRTPSAGLAVG